MLRREFDLSKFRIARCDCRVLCYPVARCACRQFWNIYVSHKPGKHTRTQSTKHELRSQDVNVLISEMVGRDDVGTGSTHWRRCRQYALFKNLHRCGSAL